MKKILCPVNFTSTALNALEFACNLAQLHKGSLTLLHILTDEEYNRLLEENIENIKLRIDQENALLEKQLESLCREIRNSYPDLKCDYALGYGDLTAGVTDFAATGGYSLIVMGNDGVVNVTEALDGSSTVKVLEKSPCPLMSVPGGAVFKGFQRIVFGSEFRKADRDALLQLSLYIEPAASSLYVVHISRQEEENKAAALRKEGDELRTYINYPKLHIKVKESPEGVLSGLDESMEELNADLLVLVTHQRNFLERIFQKSVSKQISYFADYPILIFLEERL